MPEQQFLPKQFYKANIIKQILLNMAKRLIAAVYI